MLGLLHLLGWPVYSGGTFGKVGWIYETRDLCG